MSFYLIDTINGREQITENYNAIKEYWGWADFIGSEGISFLPEDNEYNKQVVVITYALDWLSQNLTFSFLSECFMAFLIDVGYSLKVLNRLKEFADRYLLELRFEAIKERASAVRKRLQRKPVFPSFSF